MEGVGNMGAAGWVASSRMCAGGSRGRALAAWTPRWVDGVVERGTGGEGRRAIWGGGMNVFCEGFCNGVAATQVPWWVGTGGRGGGYLGGGQRDVVCEGFTRAWMPQWGMCPGCAGRTEGGGQAMGYGTLHRRA